MRVAVIGGKESQSTNLRESAARAGFDLWFLDQQVVDMASRIQELDAVAIFTDTVSPQERQAALEVARTKCIPAFCASCEGAALCGLNRKIN